MKLHLLRAALAVLGIALAIAPAASPLSAQTENSMSAAPSGYIFMSGEIAGECVSEPYSDC